MPTKTNPKLGQHAKRPRADILARLGLDPQDLAELANQGFVAEERRGNSTNFKLRFRRDGRQVARYLRGPAEAAEVRAELEQLQSNRRLRRRLAARAAEARELIRALKIQLEPLLAQQGLKFHGRDIRRPRRPPDMRCQQPVFNEQENRHDTREN